LSAPAMGCSDASSSRVARRKTGYPWRRSTEMGPYISTLPRICRALQVYLLCRIETLLKWMR
jgi:hypothetical protein